MKKDELIRGYRIITAPTNSGGGRCVWAFAEKGDDRYFIKQFLDPKWPTDRSMGSPASKQRRREECLEFERRHREVNNRINPRALGGGNLVTAIDFFREDTSYYKVTDRIEAEKAGDLRRYTIRQVAVILRTLCLSIRLLHRAGIVHGDLKPDNVLLQKSSTGDLYTAKVIDFDDAYPNGKPPPPDQVVGDQQYGAPEWLRYVKGDPAVAPAKLTTAADVFALGLVFHVYLTGTLPGYDQARFGAPAEAVWSAQPLELSPVLDPRIANVLRRMMSPTITDRPNLDQLIAALADERVLVTRDRAEHVPATPPPETGPRGSRLRVNLDRREPAPPGASIDTPAKSRVRKNLGGSSHA
jgi:serine/threonine protein kinase